MDKLKIGIPRALYYYYFIDFWNYFFKDLDVELIISPKTNKKIIQKGISISNDEMCMSLKNYIGHVDYLKDKCDMILIPRIDNYGLNNQTCTNFLSTVDIIRNIISIPILDYNIDVEHNETEQNAFIKIGTKLGLSKKEITKRYEIAKKESGNIKDAKIKQNLKNLKSDKIKILVVGHPYNIYDEYIGKPIINYLKQNNIEIIYSDLFPTSKALKLSKNLSHQCYFKYNKENIGAIEICKNEIDGIIFLSTFPCGPDSLVNELVMRKINIPYLNLICDDGNVLTGFETRIESYIDILERRKNEESIISTNG